MAPPPVALGDGAMEAGTMSDYITMSTECLACGHTWVAVFPENVTALLECPACGVSAGFNQIAQEAPDDII